MRASYERAADLDEVLVLVRKQSARTVVFDVEPLVARWDSGQDALDRGVALIAERTALVPCVRVLCFATNSLRRPSEIPGCAGAQVVYFASAGKPLRTARYREFPRPGMVIGDQTATDGILAYRLGYTYVQYCQPMAGVPAGPRLMYGLGLLVQPLLFTGPRDRRYARAADPRGRSAARTPRPGAPAAP
jgi:hypothetical protein